MARPVDWSSTTITVFCAEGKTCTCALAINPPSIEKATPRPPDCPARPTAFECFLHCGWCRKRDSTLTVLPPADFESAYLAPTAPFFMHVEPAWATRPSPMPSKTIGVWIDRAYIRWRLPGKVTSGWAG